MPHLNWVKEQAHRNLLKIRLKTDSRMGPVIVFEFDKTKIGFAFCHRRKDRSIKMSGFTFPLCSRCTGIWLGFGTGLLLHIAGFNMPFVFAAGFMLPLLVDGLTQLAGFRESNNWLRLLTGILFGIATNMLFLWGSS